MNKPRVVSLYTGAGGLDYGFEAAGCEIRVAVEMDGASCATIRANRSWSIIEKNINATASREILEKGSLQTGDIELLIGGPPCQPFSKAAYWARGDTKRLEDPRADTLTAYMRCVADLLPQVFVLENVHGINYSGKEEGFKLIERLTDQINKAQGTSYTLSWKVINTADYGVPQLRKRFFLVGYREGTKFEFPSQTHIPSDDEGLQISLTDAIDLYPYVTAWDAIGKLEPDKQEELQMKGKWAGLLPSIPEGENYLWHTNRRGGLPIFGWRTRYWNFLLKLAKNQPSWTIPAQPGPAIGPFHWSNRQLSITEMARLQTFPDDIVLMGGRSSKQQQLGNAVPSLFSEILARAIGRQFWGISYNEPLRLAIPYQRPIPQPELISAVPESYLDLVGDHPDHPGTGKGPAAQGTNLLVESLTD